HDFGLTEFDQHRPCRMLGETPSDHQRTKLVVEATVFTFGHDANPSSHAGGAAVGSGRKKSDSFGVPYVEGLTAYDRVHRTIELGLGLADHVLSRGPRRDVGEQ